MSSDVVGSALLRRHIGRRFAGLRTAAGLTQQQAAEKVQRGRATIARIEDGDERVRFREVDVRALLDVYGAPEQERQVLLALAAETRGGRRRSWWHDYTDTALPPWFELFVLLEDSAEVIRAYEPELVPGLLQTRGYAERVLRAVPGRADDDVRQRVEVRLRRQGLLDRPRAPHLQVVLGEAALRTAPGEQLAHLLEVSTRVGVSVQVLPQSAGVHAGTAAGTAFTLLEFPVDRLTGEPLEPATVYVDTLTGALYLSQPEEVAAYRAVWDEVGALALDGHTSREAIIEARGGSGGSE